MKRVSILLVVACAAAAAVLFAGAGRPEAAQGDTTPSATTPVSTVTTTGQGVVSTVPDQATITAGVQVHATTATAALSQCSAAATRVVSALRAAGGRDLQTQSVSLQPQTNDSDVTTGYIASNNVTADIAVARAGALIDAATRAGATTIDGPSLSVADQTALYRQALGLALADAKAKAEALAKAGGFVVGSVTAVTEQSSSAPVPFAASAAKDATPVEAGQQQIEADVQASFAIG
jgi:uncharacterized protein YggE